jgi:hypothetical protein
VQVPDRPPTLRPAPRRGLALAQLRGAATGVARRAEHGVTVLLKIYAHRIDWKADAANKWITDALGTCDTQPKVGDEADDDRHAS